MSEMKTYLGYNVIRELGRGAKGVVYLVEKDSSRFALKTLMREDGPGHLDSVLRFRQEMMALSSLNHPNIVRVIEAGEHEGEHFTVMEFLDGRNLHSVLQDGALEQQRAVEIARQLASALEEIHRQKLIHRDVKPENIVMVADGSVKLIDFGMVAGLATGPTRRNSEPVVGTLEYASPEQSGLTTHPVTESSDLYSLGVVMYEMLVGKSPFHGAEQSLVLQQKTQTEPKNPHNVNPKISFVLGQIIAKLLEPDPSLRYRSARGLIADLQALSSMEESHRNSAPYVLGSQDRAMRLLEGPLVGRQQEIDMLKQAWNTAKSGSGGTLFVEGDAGVGKTRLAQEIIEVVRSENGEVLNARCSQVGAIALAPVLDLLKQYFNELILRTPEERTPILASLKGLPVRTLKTLANLSEDIAFVAGLERDLEAQSSVTQEVLNQHLIQVFQWIADRKAGLLLVMEDIQSIDEPSVEFLKRFTRELDQARMMIVVTGRRGSEIRGIDGTNLKLSAFSPIEAQELISSWLGGVTIDAKTAEKISGPTNYNALAMREYLSGMIDAAILTVEARIVHLDEIRLKEVGLSADANRLIHDRVLKLQGTAQQSLRLAAVLGLRFRVADLAGFVGDSSLNVELSLQTARRENLIEPLGSGDFGFVHENIRDAFLSHISADELRDLHDRAASLIEGFDSRSPQQDYDLAQHYREGNPDKNRQLTLIALAKAGQLALESYSHKTAYDFLKFAHELIGRADTRDGVEFQCNELYARACHGTGHFDEASRVINSLLAVITDPVTKGRLLFWRVKVENGGGKTEEAWKTFLVAMKVLGKGYRQNPVLKVASLVYFVSLSYTRLYLRLKIPVLTKRSPAQEMQRQKLVLVTQLIGAGITNCFMRLQMFDMINLVFRANAYVYKIGPGGEAASALSQGAAASATLGLVKPAEMGFEAAYEIANQLGDESVTTLVDYYFALSRLFLNKISEYDNFFPKYISRAEKLLNYWDLGSALVSHTAILGQQGRFREAVDFQFRKLSLIDETGNVGLMADFRETYAARLDFLGRTIEATKIRAEADRFYDQIKGSNVFTRYIKLGMRVMLAAEGLGIEDPSIDQNIEEFLSAARKGYFVALFYFCIAQVRLLQYEAAKTIEERQHRRELFERALKILKKNVRSDLIGSMTKILMAASARMAKDFAKAKILIEDGERLAENCTGESSIFYALAERARLARDMGWPERAAMEARAAYEFAKERDWHVRLVQLEKEFGVLAPVEVQNKAVVKSGTSGLSRERAMNALLEISAAASRSIDPVEQSRATLDTVIHLLGAERACIFLGADSLSLKYFLGRTGKGEDILEIKGFSTTVVRKVFEDRRPVIITGTEQGEAIGSKSIVAHNLKSIMVVPLVLSQDIKGVIYIDSSISKSLFSEADLDLLVAVSTQIASSIHFSELAAVENERQMMKKDLELSVSVQKLFLPAITDCDFSGVSLSAFYRPAAQCGGDWWWYKVREGKLYVLLADVGGHGVGPAMITASVASAHKIWEKSPTTDIGELIQSTNRHLFEIARGEHFMTMFGCEIDLESKLIKFWSAGAPPILVQNRLSPGSAFVGEAGGLLGATGNELTLGIGEYQAKRGDRLFLYSDGISEMTDEKGRPLGYRRMASILEQLKVQDVHQLKGSLVQRLDQMRGSSPQDDDFTFIAIDII